jgi:hypothetical protein
MLAAKAAVVRCIPVHFQAAHIQILKRGDGASKRLPILGIGDLTEDAA